MSQSMRHVRSGNDSRRLSISFKMTIWLLLAFCTLTTMPGCGGCWNQDPLARKKKEAEEKKKKPKPDFELGRLEVLPRDPATNQNFVKAGHWMAATREMKANNFDFKADSAAATVDRGERPFEIANTRFQLKSSRPVSLPKGQLKLVECQYFIPSLPKQEDGFERSRVIWLQNELLARRGGRRMRKDETPTSTLPHYQYFLVVLSTDPDRYGYLKSEKIASITPPVEDAEALTLDNILHYRVVLPQIERRVPLPSQALLWTSIAYVVWDGLNPSLLTPDQQQAVLDWLHWGGQIIISGPKSLDVLRGSFLEPYLPATGGTAVTLQPPDFTELDKNWSLTDRRAGERQGLRISAEKPPVGVTLEKHAEGHFVDGTGDLVVERSLGLGRIVVTRFALADRQIVNWGSFDSFFNGCLLRRPNRTFHLDRDGLFATVCWATAPAPSFQTDARFVTRLRYFTHDSGATDTDEALPVANSSQVEVAGWNPRSGASNASRESLKDAAGISIPKAGFVFRVLAIYLLILAPVNWGFFRLIGRVEWAWIAAPLIAIGGAFAIVRLAQLDIGFARSRTEIAVLELQGDYSRGHLTRYTALYTALATAYDLVFDDDSAFAMPFPPEMNYQRPAMEKLYTVHYRRDKNLSLSGFQVNSNATGTVQSEQMWEMKGPLQLVGDDAQGMAVKNSTQLALNDVGIIRRTEAGLYQTAWVGTLPAGEVAPLSWDDADQGAPFCENWTQSTATYSCERQRAALFEQFDADNDKRLLESEIDPSHPLAADLSQFDDDNSGGLDEMEAIKWCVLSRDGEPTLGRLFDLATLKGAIGKGDVRLLGWTDQLLPGLTTSPKPAQSLSRTMVLAHLRQGPLFPAEPDTNLRVEVDPVKSGPDDKEEQADQSGAAQ